MNKVPYNTELLGISYANEITRLQCERLPLIMVRLRNGLNYSNDCILLSNKMVTFWFEKV